MKNIKNIPFLKTYNQEKLKYGLLLDKLVSIFIKCKQSNNRNDFFKNPPKKILIVQSHLIGDVVMTTPMLKALRISYPVSQISLLANEFAKDLLGEAPYVNKIITIKFPWAMYDYSFKNLWKVFKVVRKLRKEHFDLSIDAKIDFRNIFLMYLIGAKRRLGYDITGGRAFLTDIPEFPMDVVHISEASLSLLNYMGSDTSNKTTELFVSEDAINWVEDFLKNISDSSEKLIGIHPGASKEERLWKPDRFAKVIESLRSKNYYPVIIAGPKDERVTNEIVSLLDNYHIPVVRTSLRNVVALVKKCKLIICLDSGILHIGAAVGTPCVSLYGPNSPEETRPLTGNSIALFNDKLDCRPCEYGKCKKGKNICMTSIKVENVLEAVSYSEGLGMRDLLT